MTSLTFYSPQLPDGSTAPQEFEFNGFGCNGRNQSPALVWADVPLEARSLALTAYDPDAPTGSGWWHWFVVDLPLGLSGLAADAGAEGGAQLPAGARHIRNDYGAYAWGGMCPRRVTSHTATCSRCTP
jgi:Raf kinase inhibitor-like YbhB/YbcL family protein